MNIKSFNYDQAGSKETINGTQLLATAAQQNELDETLPIKLRANLADIVRAFETSIAKRKAHKWTDAEICNWLSELGYEISQETLRTYRARLGILVRPRRSAAATPRESSNLEEISLSMAAVPTTKITECESSAEIASAQIKFRSDTDLMEAEAVNFANHDSDARDAEGIAIRKLAAERQSKTLRELDEGV